MLAINNMMLPSPMMMMDGSQLRRLAPYLASGVRRKGVAARAMQPSATAGSRRLYSGTGGMLQSTMCLPDDKATISTTTTTTTTNTNFCVHNALSQGCVDYRTSWAWQHVLLQRRLAARRRMEQQQPNHTAAADKDLVLLFEHAAVYTLGRGANESHLTFLQDAATDDPRRVALSRKTRGGARLSVDRQMENLLLAHDHDNDDNVATVVQRFLNQQYQEQSQPPVQVLAPNGVPIYRVERGGEVTWHGPGQLVVYPLFDLKRAPFCADLHWFLRQVEQVIILTLQDGFDICAARDNVNTGVWVGHCKIAAVGVAASRWITTHGFALNVHPDLAFFDTSVILPCGVEERGVTSIAQVLAERGEKDIPSVEYVAQVVLSKMEQVFGVAVLVQPQGL